MSERARAAWGLLVVASLFAATSAVWLRSIPFDQAPDEWTHFHYNVRVMVEEHRLPRVGVDDRTAYETAHPAPTGRLVARYSYANAPPPNYLAYAGAVWLGHQVAALDPITAARLLSLFWGVVFVSATWAACRACGIGASASAAATAAVAWIPQVQFVSACINQDAFSLAASACVVWAVAHDHARPSRRSFLVLGLAAGWVLVAKLNFWLLLPGVAVYGVRRIWRARDWRARATLAALAFIGAAVVGGVWIGRSVALFGSPTGQAFVLGLMRDAQGQRIDPPVDLAALAQLWRAGFVGSTFRSFLMTFDYMGLLVGVPYVYRTLGVVMAMVLIGALVALWRTRSRRAWWGAAAWFALWLAAVGQHAYNSIVWDYQPQGRYLFVVLTPTALGLAWLADRSMAVRRATWTLAAAMLGLTALAHVAVARLYAPFNGPTVAAVKHAALRPEHQVIADEILVIDRPGVHTLGVRFAVAQAYDVSFYGVEILDAVSQQVLRTAYVVPWEWRSLPTPEFRFRPFTQAPGAVRVRVFTDWPGVRPALLRADCASVAGPTGHVCFDPRE